MKEVVEKLIEKKKTISTMESCTGGALANAITNVEGASEILKFSAVTYSNEFKIKMGVPKETIDKYSVYSMETAKEMSKNISNFTNSSYGVGITGKINRPDPNNQVGSNSIIFISIYEKEKNKHYDFSIKAIDADREKNKDYIIEQITIKLKEIIKND